MEDSTRKESISKLMAEMLGELLDEKAAGAEAENKNRQERGIPQIDIPAHLAHARGYWETRISAALKPTGPELRPEEYTKKPTIQNVFESLLAAWRYSNIEADKALLSAGAHNADEMAAGLEQATAYWQDLITAALEPDFKAYKIRNAEGEFSMGGAAYGSPGFVTLGKLWHTLGGVRAHLTGWLRRNIHQHDAFVNGEIPWDVVTVHGYVAEETPVRKFYGRGKATPDAPAEDEGNANDNQ